MIGSKKYKLTNDGKKLYEDLKKQNELAKHSYICNPCGEIVINRTGGYCILTDLAPYFCKNKQEVKDIASYAVRFLIRTNLMDSIYSEETRRTNRIGLSMTGIHEFAWKEFGYEFYDLVDENKSKDFWLFLKELKEHVIEEARIYSKKIGVNNPHTITTLKPAGSISKLFALTEGAHLPAMKYYMRWVQKQNNDPLLNEYRKKGYPIRELKTYPNVSVVGFPVIPLIMRLGIPNVVTANEASIEDQYRWLQLLEKYWIGNLGEGNQISYTMKFDIDKVSLQEFKDALIKYQSQVRCCSVMPIVGQQKQKILYEYLPEEEVPYEEFIEIVSKINDPELKQEIDLHALQCSSGACPL